MKRETAGKIAKALFKYFSNDLDASISDHMAELMPEMDPEDKERICGEMTDLVVKIASEENQ